MATDWIDTTLQTLPRIGRVVRRLSPTWRARDVNSVDPAFTDQHGLRAVIWDVDGTLMAYHATDIAPEFADRLRREFVEGPARHAILSNCGEERFLELGTMFPEIPIVRGYQTGNGPVFRSMQNGQDTHSLEEARALLAAGGRQIRKPDGRLIRHAADVLGISDMHEVVMVGDQYFTDVAEANLGGARSVKVQTYRRDTFPTPIRISQRFEGLVHGITKPLHVREPAAS